MTDTTNTPRAPHHPACRYTVMDHPGDCPTARGDTLARPSPLVFTLRPTATDLEYLQDGLLVATATMSATPRAQWRATLVMPDGTQVSREYPDMGYTAAVDQVALAAAHLLAAFHRYLDADANYDAVLADFHGEAADRAGR